MFYLIKMGELSLKGGNRRYFENRLARNLKQALAGTHPAINIRSNRMYLEIKDAFTDLSEEVLDATFGIAGYSRAISAEKLIDQIQEATFSVCSTYLQSNSEASFKISARRTDKSFPLSSYQIADRLGDAVRARFPQLSVDVHNPELTIYVEIREQAYIYGNSIRGLGGLPIGTAGKGLLLLSGGIDSPVAGYLMAKRGLYLNAVYYHTHPYTSEQALEKVKSIALHLSKYCLGIRLHVVSFTEVALQIRDRANTAEITLLMRACMVRAASRIAGKIGASCLITGESLSQVASQTVESISFTNSVSGYPIFRPLIGMDKEEIIKIAETIGTFKTSILPFDDCCTVFSPDHPLIRPNRKELTTNLDSLELEGLLEKACKEAIVI